jgi:hypothetical protein
MPDKEPKTGRLKIGIPLEGDLRPTVNVIDARSLALVKTAQLDEELVVPSGAYLLSSTLPSGERAVAVADVAPGGREEVSLAAPSALLPTEQAVLARPEPIGQSALATPFYLRCLGISVRGVEVVGWTTKPVPSTSEGASVELLVEPAGYDGVVFVQVAAEGEVPLNVAVPANGMTSSQSCRVTVSAKPLSAVVSLPADAASDTVARYLHSGNLRDAASVAADAEKLLLGKMANPIGAALGGYALLRLNELTRLHEWPQNLANKFPWLPDGPIIAGEAAALKARHGDAAGYFCEAARRGLPIFADGFSMLLSRLRGYTRAEAPPGVEQDLAKEMLEHAERLLPLSLLIDFSRISLAIHGARLDDLLGSQQPIEVPPAGDGWQSLAAVQASAR